jgi:hypothetical protein
MPLHRGRNPFILILVGILMLSTLPACAAQSQAEGASSFGLFSKGNNPPQPTITLTRRASITPSMIPSTTPTLRPSQTLPPTFTPFVITPLSVSGPFFIGFSVVGRPIEIYQFGSGPIQRMIVGGIHGGNEWNTTALTRELVDYIGGHPYIIPDDITLYIVPLINPDGEARAHGVDGRVNEHGVDLNRNWDYKWQADWSRNGCWIYRPVTAGEFAGSEPETAALMNFIQNHEIDALISYHSAALGIFPAGIPPVKRSVKLAEAVAAVSPYPYPPLDTGCQFTGNMVDWASTLGIAALDIELSDHTHTDFDINLQILKVFLNWRE